MDKKKIIITINLVILWLAFVAFTMFTSGKLNGATESILSATSEAETSAAPKESVTEIVQSNYTQISFNYDNVYEALKPVVSDVSALETLSYLLTYDDVTFDSWLLHYNEALCDTYTLTVNETDAPVIQINVYKDAVYVSYNSQLGLYHFCCNGATYTYSELFAESLLDLFSKSTKDWKWNVFECLAIYGKVTNWYPNVNQNVSNDGIVLDSGVVLRLGSASVKNEEYSFELYEGIGMDIVSAPTPETFWMLHDSLNLEQFVEWCKDNNAEVPTDIETLFSDYQPVCHDYWYAEIINQVLYIYDVELIDEEYKETLLLTYDYSRDVYSIKY